MGRAVPESVKAALRDSIKGSRVLPHLSELAEHFLVIAGGPRKVAEMLYEEWVESNPGGVVRARILDLITRVWKHASETVGNQQDLSQLDDADLDRELREVLGEMGEAASGKE
jgi:hypothetical protein